MTLSSVWRFGFNDATFGGWLITATYLTAFLLCIANWLTLRLATDNEAAIESRTWLLLAIILLGLGINKQLDLQTVLIHGGRFVAKQSGMFGYRRALQKIFVFSVAALTGGLMIFAGFKKQTFLRRHILIPIGFVLLAGFIFRRMSTFCHVALFTDSTQLLKRADHTLEFAGAFCVVVSAGIKLYDTQRRRSPPGGSQQQEPDN